MVESISTPSNLNEVTLSIGSVDVVSKGKLARARGPRTISLVLDVINCMSFRVDQSIKF